MNLQLLASEYAKDPDFNKLVPMPRGRIERFEIKVALLTMGGKALYEQVVAAIPAFATDPDFSEIDVLHPFSATVFDGLVQANILTQEQRAVIASLGYEQAPRWKALGFYRELDIGDFIKAGVL